MIFIKFWGEMQILKFLLNEKSWDNNGETVFQGEKERESIRDQETGIRTAKNVKNPKCHAETSRKQSATPNLVQRMGDEGEESKVTITR
jgi:hypothetical protein